MADIQQGTVVTIAADIMVNGVLTFGRGEQVSVAQVAPNPERPEYRYTVQSARTGTWYQLRDADVIAPAPQQQPGAYAPPGVAPQPQQFAPQPRAPRPARTGGGGAGISEMTTPDWLVGGGALLMLIGVFFYFSGIGFFFPIVAIGLIVLVVLDKIVQTPAIVEWRGLTLLYIIVGAVGTGLGALGFLWLISWTHGLISTMWYVAPAMELLGNVLVLVGGIMRRKSEM